MNLRLSDSSAEFNMLTHSSLVTINNYVSGVLIWSRSDLKKNKPTDAMNVFTAHRKRRSLIPRGHDYELTMVSRKLHHQSFIPRSLFK